MRLCIGPAATCLADLLGVWIGFLRPVDRIVSPIFYSGSNFDSELNYIILNVIQGHQTDPPPELNSLGF